METLGRTHIQLQDLLDSRQQLHKVQLLGHSRLQSALPGEQFSKLRSRGMEFDQVRTYQAGDDARYIDWRATARIGKTQSKVFYEERERPLFILVEQSPAMFFASCGNFKSVQAAYIASLFAWAGHNRQDRVGGLVFADAPTAFIAPQRYKQGIFRLLNALAEANQALTHPHSHSEANPLERALSYALPRLRPSTLLVIISCERQLNSHNSALLRALTQRFDAIFVPVSDPLEHRLPEGIALSFEQQQQLLTLSPTANQLHQAWAEQARMRVQDWQQLAEQTHSPLLPISTATTLTAQLSHTADSLDGGVPHAAKP